MKNQSNQSYEDLALMPSVLAELVANEPYTNSEMSIHLRSAKLGIQVETLRQKMADDQKEKFIELCDQKCERAYSAGSKWFRRIVGMEDGRSLMEMFLRHWLASFLLYGKIGRVKESEL